MGQNHAHTGRRQAGQTEGGNGETAKGRREKTAVRVRGASFPTEYLGLLRVPVREEPGPPHPGPDGLL
jgi:hypothetical protein